MLTQFIGEIPRSKAVPHNHSTRRLSSSSGAGTMWTETKKAPVRAGDVIFLPRKQLHSLECTSDEADARRLGDRPRRQPGDQLLLIR